MKLYPLLKTIFINTTIVTNLAFSIIGFIPASQAEILTPNKLKNAPIKLQDKLFLYLQLLKGNSTAQSYIDFINQNPDWPNHAYFMTLMQKAIIFETDKHSIENICKKQNLTLSSAIAFCAQQTTITPKLIQEAKQSWINSISLPEDEQEILSLFKSYFTTEDHWKRFDRLENAGITTTATRQLTYLSPQQQRLAQARLAFRNKQSNAEEQFNNLTSDERKDIGLTYDYLHWLRLQDRKDDAVQLWIKTGFTAEQTSQQKRFWKERNGLVHDLLNDNNPQSAYKLINANNCNESSCIYEEAFLTGLINLKYLNNPLNSIDYFKKLTKSEAIKNKSRGYYWLGQAYQALNDTDKARKNWLHASEFPTEFYGQMAIAKLHGTYPNNIVLYPDQLIPDIHNQLSKILKNHSDPNQLKYFKNNELIKIAQILIEQKDYLHAYSFILAFLKKHPNLTEQITIAQLANQLHFPAAAVAISHIASKKGIILLKEGWPRPYTPNEHKLPSGLSLAIMRQESGFNPIIVSQAHAYGLMQLLPSTAREMTKKAGIPYKMGDPNNLIIPDNNIKLGTTYLNKLMQQFNHNLIYVIASYNAGPSKVRRWIRNNNINLDKNSSMDNTIDWIEHIPYSETRNYVQRVLANMIIYQTNINK